VASTSARSHKNKVSANEARKQILLDTGFMGSCQGLRPAQGPDHAKTNLSSLACNNFTLAATLLPSITAEGKTID